LMALAPPFGFKGGSYPGTGGTCGANLASLATCSLVVTFSPSSPGTHTDTLEISYNDGLNPQTVSRDLQGISADAALLSISDGPTYDFGPRALTSVAEHTFVVTNTGSIAASSLEASPLSSPFSFKGGTYPGAGGNCGLTLAPSASCNLVVTFSPTSTGLKT